MRYYRGQWGQNCCVKTALLLRLWIEKSNFANFKMQLTKSHAVASRKSLKLFIAHYCYYNQNMPRYTNSKISYYRSWWGQNWCVETAILHGFLKRTLLILKFNWPNPLLLPQENLENFSSHMIDITIKICPGK